jgi:hypothetical protein
MQYTPMTAKPLGVQKGQRNTLTQENVGRNLDNNIYILREEEPDIKSRIRQQSALS